MGAIRCALKSLACPVGLCCLCSRKGHSAAVLAVREGGDLEGENQVTRLGWGEVFHPPRRLSSASPPLLPYDSRPHLPFSRSTLRYDFVCVDSNSRTHLDLRLPLVLCSRCCRPSFMPRFKPESTTWPDRLSTPSACRRPNTRQLRWPAGSEVRSFFVLFSAREETARERMGRFRALASSSASVPPPSVSEVAPSRGPL